MSSLQYTERDQENEVRERFEGNLNERKGLSESLRTRAGADYLTTGTVLHSPSLNKPLVGRLV